eukprot:1159611-Pelagomonas_calceolata.AAC.12
MFHMSQMSPGPGINHTVLLLSYWFNFGSKACGYSGTGGVDGLDIRLGLCCGCKFGCGSLCAATIMNAFCCTLQVVRTACTVQQQHMGRKWPWQALEGCTMHHGTDVHALLPSPGQSTSHGPTTSPGGMHNASWYRCACSVTESWPKHLPWTHNKYSKLLSL